MSSTNPIKVLVCGGRDYADRQTLFACMDQLRQRQAIGLIIHGKARGADTLAGDWAAARGIPIQEFEAQWKTHGRRAGYLRNRRMLEQGRPDLVIAFPGGPGTANMVQLSREAGVPVKVVPEDSLPANQPPTPQPIFQQSRTASGLFRQAQAQAARQAAASQNPPPAPTNGNIFFPKA